MQFCSAAAAGRTCMLLLLLLLRLTASSATKSLTDSDCPWRHCQDLVVSEYPVISSIYRTVAVSVHRCWPPPSPPSLPNSPTSTSCSMPAGLTSPGQVVSFRLTRADLTAAPLSQICRRFPNLTELDLTDNSIEDGLSATTVGVDHESCQLAQLRRLNLSANRLKHLDLADYLELLPSLEKLDVSDNPSLESLYISRLTPERHFRLKTLTAARCGLKQVDLSLVRLVSLQDVSLSGNRLAEVTNRLGWVWTTSDVRAIERQRDRMRLEDPAYYVRLSVLLLHNKFGAGAFGPNRLWGLLVPDIGPEQRQADAVVNHLKRFRDAFQSFVDVDNSGSTVACDCRLLHAWRFFRAVYADPREFSKRNALSLDYWTGLPCAGDPARRTLLALNESDLVCRHADACPAGCACLETVRPAGLTIDCEGAGLRRLPRRLPVSVHGGSLYELRLSGNAIADLNDQDTAADGSSSSVGPLVQGLDLSYNALTAETDFTPLQRFTALRWLNLTGNPMRDLPDSLLNLTAHRARLRLLFTGQGFVCSCGLFQPAKWRLVRAALVNYRDVQCDSETGERMRSLLEYRHRYCPARYNSTSVVYKERHVVNQSVVIGVGIVSGALVAVLLLITLVVIATNVSRRRRRQHRPSAARHPTLESSAAAAAAASTVTSAASPLVGVLCSTSGSGKCHHCRDQLQHRLLQHRSDSAAPLRVGIPPDLVPSTGSPYDTPRYVDFERFSRDSLAAVKASYGDSDSSGGSSSDLSSDLTCGPTIGPRETAELQQQPYQRQQLTDRPHRHRRKHGRQRQHQQQQRRSLQLIGSRLPQPPPLPPPRLTIAPPPPLPPLPIAGLVAIPPCAKYSSIGAGGVSGVETDV